MLINLIHLSCSISSDSGGAPSQNAVRTEESFSQYSGHAQNGAAVLNGSSMVDTNSHFTDNPFYYYQPTPSHAQDAVNEQLPDFNFDLSELGLMAMYAIPIALITEPFICDAHQSYLCAFFAV